MKWTKKSFVIWLVLVLVLNFSLFPVVNSIYPTACLAKTLSAFLVGVSSSWFGMYIGNKFA